MTVKPMHLALAAVAAGVGYLWWRGRQVHYRGQNESGFADVIVDDGNYGGSSPGAVSVAKGVAGGGGPSFSGAGPEPTQGFYGDASPTSGGGGGAGLAPVPTSPILPGTWTHTPPPSGYAPSTGAGQAPPPLYDPVPRPAVTVAKTAAPVAPGEVSGRMDVVTLGSGGLFGSLPLSIRRSPAVTTDGATPQAVAGAKTAAKSPFG